MNTTSCRINTVSYSECKNSNHKRNHQIRSLIKNRYFTKDTGKQIVFYSNSNALSTSL